MSCLFFIIYLLVGYIILELGVKVVEGEEKVDTEANEGNSFEAFLSKMNKPNRIGLRGRMEDCKWSESYEKLIKKGIEDYHIIHRIQNEDELAEGKCYFRDKEGFIDLDSFSATCFFKLGSVTIQSFLLSNFTKCGLFGYETGHGNKRKVNWEMEGEELRTLNNIKLMSQVEPPSDLMKSLIDKLSDYNVLIGMTKNRLDDEVEAISKLNEDQNGDARMNLRNCNEIENHEINTSKIHFYLPSGQDQNNLNVGNRENEDGKSVGENQSFQRNIIFHQFDCIFSDLLPHLYSSIQAPPTQQEVATSEEQTEIVREANYVENPMYNQELDDDEVKREENISSRLGDMRIESPPQNPIQDNETLIPDGDEPCQLSCNIPYSELKTSQDGKTRFTILSRHDVESLILGYHDITLDSKIKNKFQYEQVILYIYFSPFIMFLSSH